MRYMLLVKTPPSAWEGWEGPVDGFERTIEFMGKLNAELTETGELIDAAGLADPTVGTTVRKRDDRVVIIDGPSPDGADVIGGYWVLDCDSFDRASEIAARVVAFDGVNSPDVIEVRPIMDANSGQEM
ncbi:YciI family protein [Haloechinothrix salitolerans]|uniref:YciI family protein n=1 Tax=Haloechinothrix salitolerans TaxID=926830 RepID=A0ABW2C052_9PSEU